MTGGREGGKELVKTEVSEERKRMKFLKGREGEQERGEREGTKGESKKANISTWKQTIRGEMIDEIGR